MNLRISDLKLNGYSWKEIQAHLAILEGIDLTINAIKKRYFRLLNSSKVLNYNEQTISDLNCDLSYDKILLIKLEKLKLQDEKNELSALYRKLAREESIIEIAREAINKIDLALLELDNDIVFNNNHKDTSALLLISDWHYGLETQNIYNSYSPEICKERVQSLLSKVIEEIRINKLTHLTVFNLGDMISGLIHLPLRLYTRKDVITLTLEVSYILIDFIYKLSRYVHVDYYSVLDNHSRLDPNKKEAIQLESLARITHEMMNLAFRKNKNVSILDNLIDLNICNALLHRMNIVGVHGDLDKRTKILSTLPNFLETKPDLICTAHLHRFNADENDNTLVVCNGSLVGTDDYAFNKRFTNKPSLTLILLKDNNIILSILTLC